MLDKGFSLKILSFATERFRCESGREGCKRNDTSQPVADFLDKYLAQWSLTHFFCLLS